MRKKNRIVLRKKIEETLKNKTASYWEKKLNNAGVPVGLILSIPEIIKHDQISSKHFTTKLPTEDIIGRDIEIMRSAVRTKTSKPEPVSPPPTLGQDTFAVLEELGFELKTIQDFSKQGVI